MDSMEYLRDEGFVFVLFGVLKMENGWKRAAALVLYPHPDSQGGARDSVLMENEEEKRKRGRRHALPTKEQEESKKKAMVRK